MEEWKYGSNKLFSSSHSQTYTLILFSEASLRVPLPGPHGCTIDIHLAVLRCPGIEPVHITVEHTESRCDQNRIVNFTIRCSVFFCVFDLLLRHILTADLYTARQWSAVILIFQKYLRVENLF